MQDSIFQHANPNYLNQLTKLSHSDNLAINEDIHNAKGVKLISAGTKLSPELSERILQHKLKKPLETSISVDPHKILGELTDACIEVFDACPHLHPLIDWKAGSINTISLLKQIRLEMTTAVALNLFKQHEHNGLKHIAMMCLASTGIAFHAKFSPNDILDILIAAINHDIGMLYINPNLFQHQEKLSPEEWRHIANHPLIAKVILKDIINASPKVIRYVAEHHENINGTGYPRQLRDNQLSLGGMLLSAAEQTSPLLMAKEHAVERTQIALQVLPNDLHQNIAQIITQKLKMAPQQPISLKHSEKETKSNIHQLFATIANIISVFDQLQTKLEFQPGILSELLSTTMLRFDEIQRAFSSTGLDMISNQGDLCQPEDTQMILHEANLVLNELSYRLRQLARHLSLQLNELQEHETAIFTPLIAALDGTLNLGLDLQLQDNVDFF